MLFVQGVYRWTRAQNWRRMTLSRNGTLERTPSRQFGSEAGDSDSTRLHHTNLSSPVVDPVTPAVVVPPPYSSSKVATEPLELRASLDCWACSVLVTVQNLIIAAVNVTLASVVFGIILTPALTMVVFGFLCHSKVQPGGTSAYCSDLLNDASCVALLVVGFLLLVPLLVLALAAYCRLARHLQLGLCFIPYSRAVYKNLPVSQHPGLQGCCGQQEAPERDGKAGEWV
ncbi:transmembrane protein 88a isoform 2-T2 [Clarias gariepinus]|uniref:transmembrane protein 88a isoform X2 n=1 Tax=Clarias gariepinus TaxID=13013 RepID=UPI00234D74A2|nr:transmembrane protein 88a isoform X2 [Clarias gariepinus]